MAFLPANPTQGTMPSPMDMGGMTPSAAPGGGDQGALMGLLGAAGGMPTGASPAGGPAQFALAELDDIQMRIMDLARQFPGSEQIVDQLVQLLMGLRQLIAISASQAPQEQMGAEQML